MLLTSGFIMVLALGAPPLSAAQPAATQQGKQAQALADLLGRLPAQLSAAGAPDAQRLVVMELVAKLEGILAQQPATPAQQETQVREYLARGGELRDLMDDLHLPDPGDLLPPGPRSRLGIMFRPDERDGRAVVTRVLPQYRADKMGMQLLDVIVSLNGTPVFARDLVEQVVKAKRPYRIDVLRGGKQMTLEEPQR